MSATQTSSTLSTPRPPVASTSPALVSPVRLPYLPGLDGLRAVAVIAVLIYHGMTEWLPGGFLGVEMFFVISGYLITSLLLIEWGQTGRINLKAFWLRRARRLLPALFLVLFASLTYAVLFLPDELARLRNDAVASLLYVMNWHLIFSQESYFQTVARPSLLRHVWSLAIEEQFYLLWPPLFVAGMGLLRKRGLLALTLIGTVASTLWMAALYLPDADPSRIYYGTDTRVAALLVGAMLALVWSPWRAPRPTQRGVARAMDGIGLVALGLVVWLNVWLTEYQPMLYQGGFLTVSLLTAVVIAVTVHPSSRLLTWVLGGKVLRWVGLRSYGIYLWHWPVFMVTRPQLDVPLEGLTLFANQVTLTLVLAELSYRLIEMPIRHGVLEYAWSALQTARGRERQRLGTVWAASLMGLVTYSVVLGAVLASAEDPLPPSYLAVPSVDSFATALPLPAASEPLAEVSGSLLPIAASDEAREERALILRQMPGQPLVREVDEVRAARADVRPSVPTASPFEQSLTEQRLALRGVAPEPPGPPTAPAETSQPSASPPDDRLRLEAEAVAAEAPSQELSPAEEKLTPIEVGQPPAPPARHAPAPVFPRGSPTWVTAIGDSVMLGAADAVFAAIGNVYIDASVSRQGWDVASILRARWNANQLGPIVVIHVGNNGVVTPRQFDEWMSIIGAQRQVVFVNYKVPRTWQGSNNGVLAAKVAEHPNTRLVNWYAASAARPDFFWSDGIHLRPEGAAVYAQLIAAAIAP